MPKPQMAMSPKAHERECRIHQFCFKFNGEGLCTELPTPYPLADRRLKREWSPTLPGIPAS
jgi:hypothetical protein